MEGVTGVAHKLDVARSQFAEQCHALETLQEALAGESEHLRRFDQAEVIRGLRSQMAQKIERIQRMESAARCASNMATLIGSAASFLVGSIAAAASGSQEHPLLVGTRMANEALESKEPYGRVLVAVGLRGIPDEVNVIPASQWARELGWSEAAVEAAIRAKGRVLLSPDAFDKLMDSLEHDILSGSVILPVSPNSLLPKLAAASVVWVPRRVTLGLPLPAVTKTSVSVEKQP